MKMNENKEENKIPQMTDEERIELCQKLDQELDDFINSLERKRYTEGWPEERWEEEMDKHPFFMKSTPENGELSPLAEGLAQLKYDPEENTPLELANVYKEHGNFNFRHKNYRLAVLGYTEGIKIKADDPVLNASLYNNRAAAQWFLKNYRSALFDSERALSFNAEHTKSRLRAAKCAFEIEKYDLCLEHCEILLQTQGNNEEFLILRDIAKNKKLIQERDERKKDRLNEKKKEKKAEVIQAIIERGLKIANCDDIDDLELCMLEPYMPGEHESIVHLEDGILKWPVLLLYPEQQITDFIKECPENVPLVNQLEQLFPTPWDYENKYYVENIHIYFEGTDELPHLVDPTRNLGDLLATKHYEIKAGTPTFMILPRGSRMEKAYLDSYI